MIQDFYREFRCTCGRSFPDGKAQEAINHVLVRHMRPKDWKTEEHVKLRVQVAIYPDPFIEGGQIPKEKNKNAHTDVRANVQ